MASSKGCVARNSPLLLLRPGLFIGAGQAAVLVAGRLPTGSDVEGSASTTIASVTSGTVADSGATGVGLTAFSTSTAVRRRRSWRLETG